MKTYYDVIWLNGSYEAVNCSSIEEALKRLPYPADVIEETPYGARVTCLRTAHDGSTYKIWFFIKGRVA